MHRRLKAAVAHGIADLGDERTALAAEIEQLAGLILIAHGLELDDLHRKARVSRRQLARDFVSLRQRHHALARADPHQSLCQ